MKRMDRYVETSDEPKVTRSNQNQDLYDSIGSNTRYTSFSDVTNSNAIDLSSKKNYNTREGYHQLKQYQDTVPMPRVKKELEDFKSLYQEKENKVYDINSVLEEARKNRLEKDELEEKRKLKNTSYNILANLNPEELEKYRKEKQNKKKHQNDDDLRELIDTITSATLAGDIKAASELLGDLMATSIMDPVTKEDANEDDLSSEIIKIEATKTEIKPIDDTSEEIEKNEKLTGADKDFYTRSMDLSDEDFDMDDDFREKSLPIGIKVLIFLIIVVIIGVVGYFVWKNH